jgi:uncharacterized membrane protein YfhO
MRYEYIGISVFRSLLTWCRKTQKRSLGARSPTNVSPKTAGNRLAIKRAFLVKLKLTAQKKRPWLFVVLSGYLPAA